MPRDSHQNHDPASTAGAGSGPSAIEARAKKEEARLQAHFAQQLKDDMLRMQKEELFSDLVFTNGTHSVSGHKMMIKTRLKDAFQDDWITHPEGSAPVLQVKVDTQEELQQFVSTLYSSEKLDTECILSKLKPPSDVSAPYASAAETESDRSLSNFAPSTLSDRQAAEDKPDIYVSCVESGYSLDQNSNNTLKESFAAASQLQEELQQDNLQQAFSVVADVDRSDGGIQDQSVNSTANDAQDQNSSNTGGGGDGACETDAQLVKSEQDEAPACAEAQESPDAAAVQAQDSLQRETAQHTENGASPSEGTNDFRKTSGLSDVQQSQASHGPESLQESGSQAASGSALKDSLDTKDQENSQKISSDKTNSQTSVDSDKEEKKAVLKTFGDLASDLLHAFETGMDTDCCLVAEGQKFLAHRCILVVRCQYFEAMFTGLWSESSEMEVELHGVKAKSVELLLQFMYGVMVEADVKDIPSILQSADMFGMDGLKQWMGFQVSRDFCHFFHKPCQECIQSVQDVLMLASQYNLTDLLDRTKQWVARHFRRIWETQAFGSLPASLLNLCTDIVIEGMSVNNITQTTLEAHDLVRSLQRFRRAEHVQAAAIKVMDAALEFSASHFPEIMHSSEFLTWSKQGAWCYDVLLETYMMAVSLLQPEVAVEVYNSLNRMYSSILLEEESMQQIMYSDEVKKLVQKLIERCEWYFHRYIHRVVQCPQWSNLPKDKQQELLQKSSFVPVQAASSGAAQSRVAQKSAAALQQNIAHTVNMLCETDPTIFPYLSAVRAACQHTPPRQPAPKTGTVSRLSSQRTKKFDVKATREAGSQAASKPSGLGSSAASRSSREGSSTAPKSSEVGSSSVSKSSVGTVVSSASSRASEKKRPSGTKTASSEDSSKPSRVSNAAASKGTALSASNTVANTTKAPLKAGGAAKNDSTAGKSAKTSATGPGTSKSDGSSKVSGTASTGATPKQPNMGADTSAGALKRGHWSERPSGARAPEDSNRSQRPSSAREKAASEQPRASLSTSSMQSGTSARPKSAAGTAKSSSVSAGSGSRPSSARASGPGHRPQSSQLSASKTDGKGNVSQNTRKGPDGVSGKGLSSLSSSASSSRPESARSKAPGAVSSLVSSGRPGSAKPKPPGTVSSSMSSSRPGSARPAAPERSSPEASGKPGSGRPKAPVGSSPASSERPGSAKPRAPGAKTTSAASARPGSANSKVCGSVSPLVSSGRPGPAKPKAPGSSTASSPRPGSATSKALRSVSSSAASTRPGSAKSKALGAMSSGSPPSKPKVPGSVASSSRQGSAKSKAEAVSSEPGSTEPKVSVPGAFCSAEPGPKSLDSLATSSENNKKAFSFTDKADTPVPSAASANVDSVQDTGTEAQVVSKSCQENETHSPVSQEISSESVEGNHEEDVTPISSEQGKDVTLISSDVSEAENLASKPVLSGSVTKMPTEDAEMQASFSPAANDLAQFEGGSGDVHHLLTTDVVQEEDTVSTTDVVQEEDTVSTTDVVQEEDTVSRTDATRDNENKGDLDTGEKGNDASGAVFKEDCGELFEEVPKQEGDESVGSW